MSNGEMLACKYAVVRFSPSTSRIRKKNLSDRIAFSYFLLQLSLLLLLCYVIRSLSRKLRREERQRKYENDVLSKRENFSSSQNSASTRQTHFVRPFFRYLVETFRTPTRVQMVRTLEKELRTLGGESLQCFFLCYNFLQHLQTKRETS